MTKIITSKKPAQPPAKRVVFPTKGPARVIIDSKGRWTTPEQAGKDLRKK